MKTIFDMDNPFFSFMGRLADYVILNLLFLLTSCPVITIGTALCAVHEVIPRMAQGTEGSLYRTYMQAYIRNFRRTVPVWCLLLISGLVLVFDVTIAADALGAGMQRVAMPVVGCLLLLWLLVFSWIFLMGASAGEGAGNMLRTSLYTAVRNLPRSLLMILIEILPAVCYVFFMQIFLGIVLPFYVCVGFSLSAALCSVIAGRTRPVRGAPEEEEAAPGAEEPEPAGQERPVRGVPGEEEAAPDKEKSYGQ